ncbi:Lysine-specific demethylase 6A [Fragariocoptes setiger]|uniref:Adenine phosphoribosyltransferase n=1 Tax=Fragariocoptes setiger TaxID=1670756 RepID=A0ABQ7SBR8_9ACAR|nr:Lysine-specific demethylase 6A [Fragariocoptes setiger]
MDITDDTKRLNSYSAIDEFVKSIEVSKNEAQAIDALAAYQSSLSNLNEPWKDVPNLYALGLLYMHFNAYSWAITAFRQALYVEPTFERSRDVHVRLGLIFKTLKDFRLCEKHLKIALDDARPCNLSPAEIKFHLAHLLEIQGNFKGAIEAYESLLQDNRIGLTKHLTADIHRQLGWIHLYEKTPAPNSTTASANSTNKQQLIQQKLERAVTHFEISSNTKIDSRTSYYLGRCYSILGKTYDALNAYKNVIDRNETNADMWCSVGTLYQRGNQPHDAMQAYIRSLQYDKSHTQAWTNLGLLYENCQRFSDALRCYQHAQRANASSTDRSIQERISFLQSQFPRTDTEFGRSNSGFPSLKDLWNFERANIVNNRTEKSSTKETITCRPHSANFCKMNDPLNHDISNRSHSDSNGIILNQKDHKPKLDDSSQTPSVSMSLNGISSSSTIMASNKQDMKSSQTKDLQNGATVPLLQTKFNIKSTTQPSQQTTMPKLSINMTAEQVIEACKNLLTAKKIDINLLSDDTRPPYPKFSPRPHNTKDRLTPPPPSLFLETKKDALSSKLQDFCHNNPVVLVRNFAGVLKLDLGLFSTRSLVESNSEHQTDVATHIFQPIEENWDRNLGKSVWGCECRKAQMALSRYANYQATSFIESLREEQDHSNSHNSKQSFNMTRESESDSNGSASQASVFKVSGQTMVSNLPQSNYMSNSNSSTPSVNALGQSTINSFSPMATSNSASVPQSTLQVKTANSSPNKRFKRDDVPKFVRAAFNIDLSDEKKWRPQLQELNKVPVFLRVVSASNMLSHVGREIPGMNTVHMSMQVPGCRLFGHQTQNNFCSININVGPGECEWFAVANEYAPKMAKLCSQNGIDFTSDDWWPKLSSLYANNIPVYRFVQRPGDLVWMNAGTINWMQSIGWCNSISWNVGPLLEKQYTAAAIKYECNRFEFRRSAVPMIQLTWNLAYHLNLLYDEALYVCIKRVMMKSLIYCKLVIDIVMKSRNQEIKMRSKTIESQHSHVFTSHCVTCEYSTSASRDFDNSLCGSIFVCIMGTSDSSKVESVKLIESTFGMYPNFPKPGILFRDIMPVFTVPKALNQLVELMSDMVKSVRCDRIIGIESRGFLLGPAIAMRIQVPFVPVRKKGKLPGKVLAVEYALEYGHDQLEVQESAMPKGGNCVIIDDLVATGGSLLATKQLIERTGSKATACVVVIELEELNGKARLDQTPVLSIFKY